MSQLKETLSKLTMKRAAALLGPNGKDLIRAGGRYPIDLDLDVTLTEDLFLLNIDKSLVTIGPPKRPRPGLNFAAAPATSRAAMPAPHWRSFSKKSWHCIWQRPRHPAARPESSPQKN